MEVKITSILERIVAIFAPHYCIRCGKEDNIVCEACMCTECPPLLPVCVLCGKPSAGWQLCPPCRRRSQLDCVWAGGVYHGILADVLKKFKFERVKAAYRPLGMHMCTVLPYAEWVVVPVPTAAARIRQRGYDQSVLLARFIAQARGLPLSPVLSHVRATRQLGTNRVQRQKQSARMFSLVHGADVRGADILLVDDVCTTGATLSAASRLLRQHGAVRVDAVVAAWQPPVH